MKKLTLGLACALLASPLAEAAPQTLGGSVVLNISGSFRTAVSTYASGDCTAIVALVPLNTSTTLTTLSLLTLLAGGGSEQANRSITVTASKLGFTCFVTVPYKWENVDTATTQMAIIYTVKATDPGGTRPGKKQQLLKLLPIPANGTVTTLPVSVAL